MTKNLKYKSIVITIIFIFILACNILTVPFADDYDFVSKFSYQGFVDCFANTFDYWKTWGGTIIPAFFMNFFGMLNQYIFDILNSLVFCLLLILGAKNVSNKRDTANIIFIFICYWCFNIAFCESTLWTTGSAKYLWSPIVICIYITLMNNNYNFKYHDIVTIILGFLAGICNENISGAAIGISILFLIRDKMLNKSIEKYKLFSIISILLGFAVLFFAPGNAVRSSAFNFNPSLYDLYCRIIDYKNIFIQNYLVLIIISIILLLVFIIQNLIIKMKKVIEVLKNENLINFVIFILGTFACHFLMIASPLYPGRTQAILPYFFSIAILNLFNGIDFNGLVKKIIITICILLALTNIIPDFLDMYDIYRYNKLFISEIEELKSIGTTDIIIKIKKETNDSSYMINFASSFSDDKNNWTNKSYAKYLGVESIIVIQE